MKAQKIFFIFIGLLVVSLLSVVGAYLWGSGQLETKSTDISTLLAERDISREKILRLQNAQQDVENLDEITSMLDRLLPMKKEQEKLIADIISTATSDAGIPFSQVSAFSFSGGSEPSDLSGTIVSTGNPGVYEYPFNMQISEITYETVLKLLQEIETNGRIVQVDNIQISPSGTESNNVSVNLSAKAYIRP